MALNVLCPEPTQHSSLNPSMCDKESVLNYNDIIVNYSLGSS